MLISAKEKVGPHYRVTIATPDGDKLGAVFACHTDEKWYEEYVLGANGKVVVVGFNTAGAAMLTRRVEQAQFDVVDRYTGEVLYEVR